MFKSWNLLRLVIFSLVLALAGSSLRADLPRPPKPDPAPAPDKSQPQLVITTDNDAKIAHLRLPRSVVESLAPQVQRHSDSGISPIRTVVAGLALASALAISGLFLARGKFSRGPNALIIVAVGLLGVLTTLVMADIAPRDPNTSRYRPIHLRPAPEIAGIPVVIDTMDDGPVQLILPADQAAKIAPLPTTQPGIGTGFAK